MNRNPDYIAPAYQDPDGSPWHLALWDNRHQLLNQHGHRIRPNPNFAAMTGMADIAHIAKTLDRDHAYVPFRLTSRELRYLTVYGEQMALAVMEPHRRQLRRPSIRQCINIGKAIEHSVMEKTVEECWKYWNGPDRFFNDKLRVTSTLLLMGWNATQSYLTERPYFRVQCDRDMVCVDAETLKEPLWSSTYLDSAPESQPMLAPSSEIYFPLGVREFIDSFLKQTNFGVYRIDLQKTHRELLTEKEATLMSPLRVHAFQHGHKLIEEFIKREWMVPV